jgi:hypothetical protein
MLGLAVEEPSNISCLSVPVLLIGVRPMGLALEAWHGHAVIIPFDPIGA